MKQWYSLDLRCMCTPVQRSVDLVNKRHGIRKLPLQSHSRAQCQNRWRLPPHWRIGEDRHRRNLNKQLIFLFLKNCLTKKLVMSYIAIEYIVMLHCDCSIYIFG